MDITTFMPLQAFTIVRLYAKAYVLVLVAYTSIFLG